MKISRHFIIINQSCGPFFQLTAETLARRGHTVTFLGGEDFRFECTGLNYVAGPSYQRQSIRTRAISWARFLLFVARYLRRVSGSAVVMSSSNPPLLPHVCELVLAGRVPHVARILDIYPNVLASNAATARRPIVSGLWHLANRVIYPRCAELVTLGHVMAETLARDAGGRRPVMIPDWYTIDPGQVPARLDNPMRQELGLGDRLVVLYSGNLGLAHDLSVMIAAAESLRGDDRVRFVIIGQGPQRERLQSTVKERKLEGQFLFLPFQPMERLPISLGLGDLSVVTLSPGTESVIMPCKTYNYLAAGSAVLALVRRPSDLAFVVEQNGCGVVVAPGDAPGFVAAIRKVLDDPQMLSTLRARASQTAITLFSPEQCSTHLVELLEKIAG